MLKDVLDRIKRIFEDNNGYIKESSYKQSIFESFLKNWDILMILQKK